MMMAAFFEVSIFHAEEHLMQIHNCHVHVFTINHVPEDFLPLRLVRFLAKRRFTKGVARILHRLNWKSDVDTFDRYAAFLQIGSLGDQRDIFANIQRFYPDNARFVALSMDMEHMACGRCRRSFIEQLDDLASMKKEFGDALLPFICVHPQREKLLGLVREYIEEKGFHGIKLYPPLGYFPYDSRLAPIWEYAQKNQIPVIAHTSKGGVCYRGMMADDMFRESRIGTITVGEQSNQELCSHFSHPKNYEHLLNDFPKLKIALGHCGGDTEWKAYLNDPPVPAINENWLNIILSLVKKYPTLYADISYTLHDPRFLNYLKVLLQDANLKTKILFGSDYYLVQMDTSEKSFSIDLRAGLGEQDYRQIAETNPKKFLF
jgi:predicted TIM-barrel fold metal-dependent hydrolase